MVILPRIGIVLGEFRKDEFIQMSENPMYSNYDIVEDFHLIEGPDLVPLEGVSKYWGQDLLRISELHDIGLKGQGTKVGVIDTGVDGNHPALESKIAGFRKYNRNGNPLSSTPKDSWGHGTHVCGIICSNSSKYSRIGVAPDSEIYVANCMGTGSRKKMIAALDWFVEKNVDVVNISMGMPGYKPIYEDVFRRLLANNILVVAAIGNDGDKSSSSPANYPSVLSVGAIQSDETMWPDSSSTTLEREDDPIQPDILAPGSLIYSSYPNDSYQMKSGTSQAAPFVSGISAILLGGTSQLNASDVKEILQVTAQVKPSGYRAEHGLISPVSAMHYTFS